MVDFKLTISDPKTGKSYNKEIKDKAADMFINLKISETVKGDAFDMPGYEFVITGGSDNCGFPMRSGILGDRKSLVLLGGVGYRPKIKGVKSRKTVCGHKVSTKISQINLKITKEGTKKLEEIFPAKAEEKQAKEKHAEKKAEEKPVKEADKKVEKLEKKAKTEEKTAKEEKKAEDGKDKGE